MTHQQKPAKTLEPRVAIPWKKFIVIAVLLGGAAFSARSFFFSIEAGYHYVYHNQLSGKYIIYSEPGTHFRLPGMSKLTRYKQVVELAFGDGGDAAFRRLPPLKIRFADTYTADIAMVFRYKLAYDPQKILDIHREFRSFDNLVDALLVKNSRNVTVVTATQYTGSEFFRDARAQFKAKVEDQLRNGVYQTERKQVATASGAMQWKTVPIQDEYGRLARHSNPLDAYGIQVTQVTLGEAVPEARLQQVLQDQSTWAGEAGVFEMRAGEIYLLDDQEIRTALSFTRIAVTGKQVQLAYQWRQRKPAGEETRSGRYSKLEALPLNLEIGSVPVRAKVRKKDKISIAYSGRGFEIKHLPDADFETFFQHTANYRVVHFRRVNRGERGGRFSYAP